MQMKLCVQHFGAEAHLDELAWVGGRDAAGQGLWTLSHSHLTHMLHLSQNGEGPGLLLAEQGGIAVAFEYTACMPDMRTQLSWVYADGGWAAVSRQTKKLYCIIVCAVWMWLGNNLFCVLQHRPSWCHLLQHGCLASAVSSTAVSDVVWRSLRKVVVAVVLVLCGLGAAVC